MNHNNLGCINNDLGSHKDRPRNNFRNSEDRTYTCLQPKRHRNTQRCICMSPGHNMGTRMYCCPDTTNNSKNLRCKMTVGKSCTAHFRWCLCMFHRCKARNTTPTHKSTPRCKYNFLLSSIQRQSNLENLYCRTSNSLLSTYPHIPRIFPLHSPCTPHYHL